MVDVAVIGCGVIGAAVAYTLSQYQLKVAVLEQHADVAVGTTKANSAIIHAGYDPAPGTLMARLNVEGNRLAGEIAEKLSVPFRRVGSLVLALSEGDLERIQTLYQRGVANGVPGIRLLSREETLAREPRLSEQVCGSLWAPSAGIIDPWEYATAMAETAVVNGVDLQLQTRVTGVEPTDFGFAIHTSRGTVEARYLVCAAGVEAATVRGMVEAPDYVIQPNRGEYFLLDHSEGEMVHSVIFQCPNELGKGVLVAPTVHGNLIVGPNAVATDDPDNCQVTASGLAYIESAARRSVPGLNLAANIRNFAGIRANSDRDEFRIERSEAYPHLIDLAGMKSPGLSAAPAVARYAVQLLEQAGLALEAKASFCDRREKFRFNELSDAERAALIAREPAYGRVICRCQTVTEGDILAALHRPIPPRSINAVKRRVGAGMGRCQGGFCSPRVHELVARELGIDPLEVCLEDPGSELLTGETKMGGMA